MEMPAWDGPLALRVGSHGCHPKIASGALRDELPALSTCSAGKKMLVLSFNGCS